MTAFDRAWNLLKNDDEWPDRVSNLLGGGTEEELFGGKYEAAKEGKTTEEHDEFMMKITELLDRIMNPGPDPFEEAMKRQLQSRERRLALEREQERME